MTTFVHCMVCFTFPVPDMKFFLSGCGHVACFNCVQKGSMTIKCKVCQKDNPQILEINRNLKPELRDLFTPLAAGFSKIARDVGYTFDFQNGHRQRLMRHLQSKSCNFERLQQFCKEEIRKKNQYKQDLQRVKVEYKKKCEEAMELKARITNISNRTASFGDLTRDPFRTPIPGTITPQRGFVTSTPYSRNRTSVGDVTETTLFGTNQTDSSTSFSAAGIPLVSMDSGGEVSKLAHMTSAMFTNQTRNKNKSSTLAGKDCDQQGGFATSSACLLSKTPATKKSKLDIMSKTQPLPLKSV